MIELLANTISVTDFYKNIPKLHLKYTKKISELNESYCFEDYISDTITKKIIVLASNECIDCIVNLHALLCIEKQSSIIIRVLIKDENLLSKYGDYKTPTIIGYDSKNKVLWKWIRVPEIIKKIENAKEQHIIIVEKRKYRFGLYLESTIDEIIELLNVKEI